jgi:murein L,D-transpeptidase YafK
MSKESCCGNCQWWKMYDVGDDEGNAMPSKYGQCRRYPPEVTKEDKLGVFPKTEKDWWCGEHDTKLKLESEV